MSAGKTYLTETLKSFRGMKSNAEKALEQLSDADLHFQPDPESNSCVIILQHISGNLISRFSGFLTSDGEKPDRNRDAEFIDHSTSRTELMSVWNKGWQILFDTLAEVKEDDLEKIVQIRGEDHTVIRALNRQLVHYAYHCGQIVYLAKLIRGKEFTSLSIPKGQSDSYRPNQDGNQSKKSQ